MFKHFMIFSTDAEIVHKGVGDIVLHIGIVLNDIVQTELIQTVIGLAVLILVEFYLETVTAAVHIFHGAEGGISLCSYANILDSFAVDDQIAWRVFLALAALDEAVPVVYNYVQLMDLAVVEDTVLIADSVRRLSDSQRLSVAEDN